MHTNDGRETITGQEALEVAIDSIKDLRAVIAKKGMPQVSVVMLTHIFMSCMVSEVLLQSTEPEDIMHLHLELCKADQTIFENGVMLEAIRQGKSMLEAILEAVITETEKQAERRDDGNHHD